MNGRCQKDALDRAEDICELCGNQYCAHCLLFPRGHRNPPTCKTCALENSGIRGGSTKYTPISKREYKKRKKELIAQLEQVEEQEPAIEFFELKDTSQFDRSTELDRRPATVAPEEPKIDILKTESTTPEPAIPPAPEASTPPPPAAAPPPVPAPDPVEPEPALAPVDTSINPLALDWSARRSTPAPEEPPESEATTSAADLLARLKADQPIQSQYTSAPAELDVDPFAAPAPAPAPAPTAPAPTAPAPLAPAAADPTAADPTAADPLPSQQRITEEWTPPAPPPRGTNLAAKLAETAHGSTAPRSGASFAPAPAPVDGSAEAPPFSEPPTGAPPLDSSPFEPAPFEPATFEPAPLDSSPFEPAPFESAPAPAATAPRTMHIAPMQDAAFIDTPMQSPPVAPEPFAEQPFPGTQSAVPAAHGAHTAEPLTEHDVADEGHPQRRKADTDDSGQWIPPTLRGMSASDDRGPLPKRRN